MYGTLLGTKPERIISAETAVFAPNCVSWSECRDGREKGNLRGKDNGFRFNP